MEIKKMDIKKAHFGSKQEEWTYYQLILLEELLETVKEMFSLIKECIPEKEKTPTVKYEIEEKKVLKEEKQVSSEIEEQNPFEAKNTVTITQENEEEKHKIAPQPVPPQKKKRGRKKKAKADDEK